MTNTNTTQSTAPITNDYYLTNKKQTVKETGNNSLGKDAFLQLLVTQLQHQDPTAPMDNTEYISQLAQFSSLEQMQNMTKAIEDLLVSQQQTQLMNYTTFIGKEVEWHEMTDELDEEGNFIVNNGKGVINQMKFVNGEPVFILEDGKELSPGNISSVFDSSSSKNEATENPLVEASKLIGQKVRYESNGEWIESIIQSVKTNNLAIEFLLETNESLTKDQFELITE
ncbi:flagellar hook assembly protein FlgD [Ureibacillus acetophenoni]|uniref:Basal-body rod modification protein FlgD n=1 Tax=Ureibacillus acetophenoni TaxID=614649 RepID=A0A285U1C2_9BACL|nr:flagellar hook assembly protein FlgD [Ureibacillus acetophenoni]SOC35533.1 flagellar basal-body rod modification protein FlgD [Ureibacillus acetophenoni]